MVTSSTELFAQSSLQILRPGSLEILSSMLNPRKRLLTDDGHLRDYRGITEFAHLEPAQCLRIESNPDHMRELVKIWCHRNVTVHDLINALMRIERFDVYDDTKDHLIKDCEYALECGVQDRVGDTRNALTLHDIRAIQKREKLGTYDAMILHSDHEFDQEFSFHLVERMETLGLKVFLPCRDMVVGTIEHSASSEIIEKRCHKVVAIFSKPFLESQQNVFLVDLAQYVNIRKKSSLLIPITLEQCDLPTTVAQLFKLKYEKSRIANFYQRFYSIFGIKDAPPELLEYPDHMNPGSNQVHSLISPNEAINPILAGSSAPRDRSLQSSASGFTNLNSVSTTYTELNTRASQLSIESNISGRLPGVPQGDEIDQDAARANSKSSSKSKSGGFFDKLFNKAKKTKAYEAVQE
ncbi:hypothetical protein TCAL_04032 [Tigriopus californicus]|uniref:TIR domain-containing protein n=1 Tax=Tigriopus californicus TaxID=6832 RepID=A0A553PGE6_TIGCA|nr:myeloid differentiation primary response protein MyD88-like [Tigriopus californicus]TRY76751.1 hypothetical protein TCAL_04032 [Tigriopus californicus]